MRAVVKFLYLWTKFRGMNIVIRESALNSFTRRFLLPVIFLLAGSVSLPAQETEQDIPPQIIYQHAIELYKDQKYTAALEKFRQFTMQGINRQRLADAYYYKALCAMELYREETVKYFLDYLEQFPEQPKAQKVYYKLSIYTFRQKDFKASVNWLNNVDTGALDKIEVTEFYFMSGYSHYKLNNYAVAKQAFAEIMNDKNPRYVMANYYYGYIAYREKAYSTAIKHFKRIQEDDKFIRIVPVYIVQFYLLQGAYNQAVNYGETALSREKTGKKKEISAYLGQAHFYMKNYSRTISYLELLVEDEFELTPVQRYQLGYAYLANGQYQRSLEHFGDLSIEKDSFGQNVAYHMGVAYLNTGEKLKAHNSFDFVSKLEFDPELKRRAYLNFAKTSYDLNYQKEALKVLRDFIDRYPESSLVEEAKGLLGRILLATRNYKEALEIIREIPEKNQEIQESYQKISYHYGVEKYENSNYRKARDLFITSLKNTKNEKYQALAYFWLGESYFKLRKYDKALHEFKNFLYVNASRETPYYILGYFNAGYSSFKAQRYRTAEKYFSGYLNRLDQDTATLRFIDATLRMGDCNLAQKKYQGALKYYSKVINKDKQGVDYALYQKGIIFGLQKKPGKKIATLRKISREHPSSPHVDDALFEIANQHFILGEYKPAINKFNYLIQDYPNSPYNRLARLKIGLIYYNTRQDRKAMKVFKALIHEHPHTLEGREAITALQNIYIDRGKADSLFTFLKTIPNISISQSFQDSASYNSAFSFLKRGNCEKAIPAFQDYLEKFSKGFFILNAHYYLAYCAYNLDKNDLALIHFDHVVATGASQFYEKALKVSSDLYYQEKNYTKALQRYRKLKEVATRNQNRIAATAGIMRTSLHNGKCNAAITHANKLLKANDVDESLKTEAKFYLGKCRYLNQEYAAALKALNEVYRNIHGDLGAEAAYYAARIHFDEKRYDTAKEVILGMQETFINSNYWLARGFILLGDIFMETGDLFQARHTYQSIIKNYDGKELIEKARRKLKKVKALEEKRKQDTTGKWMVPDTVKPD